MPGDAVMKRLPDVTGRHLPVSGIVTLCGHASFYVWMWSSHNFTGGVQ